MSRPIDADALMRAMYHRAFETDGDTMWQSGCWVRYRAIEQTVKEQPTIEERKMGKWIPVDSYSAFGGDEVMWETHGNPIAFYYCSECKEHAYAGEDGESLLTTYCPNCGARMTEEEA